MISQKRILTFFSHPDDETLAAGATLKKFRDLGADISVAIPCTGINSRKNVVKSKKIIQLEELRKDTFTALSYLGIKKNNIYFGEFSDNQMDAHTLLDLIHWVEPIIDSVKPDYIFTHHRFCTNIDHRYCHEAIVVASRPAMNNHITVLCGEVPSSTGYLKPASWEPNYYVNISENELQAKIKAMLAFKNEARPNPHPRSPEVLRALAKVRGSEGGFMFAESFMINKTFFI